MAYAQKITRAMLEEMGIVEIKKDPAVHFGWRIRRFWYKNGTSKEKTLNEIHIIENIHRHNDGRSKSYLLVNFSYKGRVKSFSLSRLLYAWFKGEVPDGHCIDHDDNNPFENNLSNLKCLTTGDNNRKRFKDNNMTCFNQFYNTVKGGKGE